jgi:succinate dehydrogenase / fumarate reductase cytochrome b subunit
MAKPSTTSRPLSPHVSIWRWHATMASSIAHRMSGVVNYIGAVLMAGPLGILVTLALIGFTLSLVYHMLNGLRHLVWDLGHGFDPQGSNLRSLLIFAGAVVITAAIWILAGGLI